VVATDFSLRSNLACRIWLLAVKASSCRWRFCTSCFLACIISKSSLLPSPIKFLSLPQTRGTYLIIHAELLQPIDHVLRISFLPPPAATNMHVATAFLPNPPYPADWLACHCLLQIAWAPWQQPLSSLHFIQEFIYVDTTHLLHFLRHHCCILLRNHLWLGKTPWTPITNFFSISVKKLYDMGILKEMNSELISLQPTTLQWIIINEVRKDSQQSCHQGGHELVLIIAGAKTPKGLAHSLRKDAWFGYTFHGCLSLILVLTFVKWLTYDECFIQHGNLSWVYFFDI